MERPPAASNCRRGGLRLCPMALHLHRAERTDLLADGLGALLADPQSDPFADELVVVPARGVERWLSQRLSHILGGGAGGDGVCAGVSFRSPASLISEIAGTGEDDPWSADAMAWPLLEVIDASLDEPWCRTLATHLGHFVDGEEKELRQGRRYAVARRLAGLFASYARQRPQLLADWLAGEPGRSRRRPALAAVPVARAGRQGGRRPAARPARQNHCPAAGIGYRAAGPDIAVRAHPIAEHRHRTHRRAGRTPRRAPVAATPQRRTVDRAARMCTARSSAARTPATGRPPTRCWPRSAATFANCSEACPRRWPATSSSAADHHRETLLGWLQSDIAANAARPRGRSHLPADRSVQVHGCHGPARQVDVLREVLLGLLADDPTLEPRDILVMCPDIEAYAPLIVADFGLGDVVPGAHPAHQLRVRLADRALIQTNPLLGVAAKLLDPGRRPGHRHRGARLRPPRAGAGAVRVHRRRSGDHHPLGAAGQHPVGVRQEHRAPFGIAVHPEHLALRARPGAGRGRDVRRLERTGSA